MTTHGSTNRLSQLEVATRRKKLALILGSTFLLMTGVMAAQAPAADAGKPADTQPTQLGYLVHHSADLGGHTGAVTGSGAMYDTLVNIHNGPRVLGETFTLHAAPGTKHLLFDSLEAWSNGFGGDPINVAKLSFSKAKQYEFTGLFRRDRQYFDYDLLGNPNLPGSLPIPIGSSAAPVGTFNFPQVMQSPVLYNTVRRMTDLNLIVKPLATVSWRFGYSQNIFQGPTLTPSYTIGKNSALISEFVRNSTDDFLFAIDWKPFTLTKLTFEEQVTHYKGDSTYTLAPQTLLFQESDGTLVAPGAWDSLTGYGISSCNTTSMGTAYTNATTYTILAASPTPGGKPVINPACDVLSSFSRREPVRTLYPIEILKFQSSDIRNLQMNGTVHFTEGRTDIPAYSENWTGLSGATRAAYFTGNGTVQRREFGFDYGITWDLAKNWQLQDSVDFSNVHQPGWAAMNEYNLNTPAAPNQTIYYSGPLTQVNSGISIGSASKGGVPLSGYFGQRFLTNNATIQWEASSRSTFSLGYRYRTHEIVQEAGTGPNADVVDINEHAGIFTAAVRPTKNWEANGSVEIAYQDNALTPISPRQLQHYRFHTRYRPVSWATISGAYNDVERSNNTNNLGVPAAAGPVQHKDHSRITSITAVVAPNDKYSFDADYSYTDIYATTNICYNNGTTTAGFPPGTAVLTPAGTPAICPGTYARGVPWGPTADFMSAPSQYASVGLTYAATKKLNTKAGYRISSVSGNQFFNDARAVQGSLQSAYQTPYLNVAYAIRPSWIWKAEYNFFGYGEGGVSGALLCSTTTSTTAAVVPCASLPNTARNLSPAGETAPRNFHANIVTLSMHYEF